MLPIVGQMAGPNKLKFFYGHSGVVGGCLRLKKFELFYIFSKFFFKFIFFHGQRRALQLVRQYIRNSKYLFLLN